MIKNNLKQKISNVVAGSLMAAILGSSIYSSVRQYIHPSMEKASITKHAAEGAHVFIIEHGDINCDGLEDKVLFWENLPLKKAALHAAVIEWGTPDGKFDPDAEVKFYCK